eukprot:jgi/Pico_ML_1/50773/g1922.t1
MWSLWRALLDLQQIKVSKIWKVMKEELSKAKYLLHHPTKPLPKLRAIQNLLRQSCNAFSSPAAAKTTIQQAS